MRIFLDGRVLIGRNFGGVGEYARLLFENLLKSAPADEFILWLNSFRDKQEVVDYWQEKFPNLRIIENRWPNRLFDLTNGFLNGPKIDKKISADVFYSPHFNILSLATPRKRILTVHDLSFIHFPEFFSWRDNLYHGRQFLTKQFRAAEKIVAVSDFTAWDLAETFKLPAEKIIRIHSGINPIFRRLAVGEILDVSAEIRQMTETRPFILIAGTTLEPRKNHIALIKAFNHLKTKPIFKDFALVIAGPKGWLFEDIFKEAGSSPFAVDIRFLGSVSDNNLVWLYNNAAVFAYPSFFEGFGFPPLEAQACGLPVVASNRSSLLEILGDSALLVDPWRIGELAEALEAVLTKDSLRQDLIKRGLVNVKRFDWQKTADGFLGLFRSLKSLE
ncbi:MAG: glycosyltransferase family 1 protein [bacterium]|nr:glycosyltransferase family 1 protein [bacterium]